MVSLLKLPNRLRRNFMQIIDKNYLSKKLSNRSGECLKCGQCCRGCKYFDVETKLCKVYENRQWFCHRDFPIDKLDQKIFKVKDCGYKF